MSTIVLTIRVYIKRSAFSSAQSAVDLTLAETPKKPGVKPEKPKKQRPGVVDETKDTDAEAILRGRKVAINRLFDKLRLKPVQSDNLLKKHRKKGKLQSKRALLEHYDGKAEKKVKADFADDDEIKGKSTTKTKGKGKEDQGKTEAEEEEGTEMTGDQVNEVYARAVQKEMDLPEMDPPDTFALTLRYGILAH